MHVAGNSSIINMLLVQILANPLGEQFGRSSTTTVITMASWSTAVSRRPFCLSQSDQHSFEFDERSHDPAATMQQCHTKSDYSENICRFMPLK